MSEVDKQLREDRKKERVPYFKYAFHNIYNYTLLGGVAAASLLTQNWWLMVAGAGAEILWMVFGPDSTVLQRAVFDKVHAGKLAEEAKAQREALLASLPPYDQHRVTALEAQHQNILRLCSENRAMTGDLLRGEIEKLGALFGSYLDLLTSTHRYTLYLEKADLDTLERESRRYEQIAARSRDPSERELAEKNLVVMRKRREKLAEIRQFVMKARGQMELIENTFKLLGDQIITMRSPKELGGQLDELIDGVEAVRSTARETDALMESIR